MRRGGYLVFLLVVLGLAGCSSGGSGTLGANGGSSSAQPGHGSPGAAVIGFLTDLRAGGDAWCSYLDPSDQHTCQEGSQEVQIKLSGNFNIGNDVVQGDQALVAVTGSLCISESGDVTTPTTECESNSDPSTGLPPKAGTFAQAYSTAVNSSNEDTTVPCIEVNGNWYVNASGLGGSTTETTTPSTIPTSTTPTSFGEGTTVPSTVPTTVP
jgi:hypothetical protein